jgi:MFS family permease
VKALLKIRDFRLLWSSQVVSTFGDALTNLALLITAQRLTGSVAAVATTAIAVALPRLLFGLPAGALVDRWNLKRTMVLSDLGRMVTVLGFIFVTSADRMWVLYAVAFVQATLGTFFDPSRTAFTPRVVGKERLLAANSISQASVVIAGVVGTAVAGVAAASLDTIAPVFIGDSLTFLVSAMLVARVMTNADPVEKGAHPPIWASVREGLSLMTSSRPLRAVMIGAGVAMLGLGAVNVLLVPFTVDTLGVSEIWFGPLEAAQVTSMVMSGALVAGLARRLRPSQLLVGGLAGAGAVVAAVGAANSVWHLMILLFLVGWFVTPVQASASTILQQTVPMELMGRAGSGLSTVSTAANVASMALAGTAAVAIGTRGVFIAGGLVTVLAALMVWGLLRNQPSPVASGAPAA